jgi:hypothetical protein
MRPWSRLSENLQVVFVLFTSDRAEALSKSRGPVELHKRPDPPSLDPQDTHEGAWNVRELMRRVGYESGSQRHCGVVRTDELRDRCRV